MKILFMGTPEFAVGALEALIEAGHEITAVVTQPDRAKGRSGRLQAPPVKECALCHDIPVLQPLRIKTPEETARLREYEADVYIVAAFGQILSEEILNIPPYGCLNIHASLLPKYRGASPIQNVIIRGEKETGVTVMQMNSGLDTGDMLYKKSIPIKEDDNYETLHDRLMALGAQAITEALPLLEAGKLVPERQDDTLSCYAPRIEKRMGHLNFAGDAVELDRLIRGVTPWPGAYTFYRGKQMKIWRAVPEDRATQAGGQVPAGRDGRQSSSGQAAPGEILRVDRDSFTVACGRDALCVREVQLEGKKRMDVRDFLLGAKMQPGERLGAGPGEQA